MKEEEAIVLYNLSTIEYGLENEDLGLTYSQEGLKLAKAAGNKALALQCSLFVCQGLVCTLQIDHAKKMAEQLLEISKEQNHAFGMISTYHFLGDCAMLSENFLEAERTYGHSISLCFQTGFLLGAIIEMQGTAISVAGQSRYCKAVRLNAATTEQSMLLGIKIPGYKFWQDLLRKHISPIRTIIGEELYNRYEEEGKKMGFEAAIEYAKDFEKD